MQSFSLKIQYFFFLKRKEKWDLERFYEIACVYLIKIIQNNTVRFPKDLIRVLNVR